VTSEDSPADLLAAALTDDPARPAVTFYDDATGERVELSVATLANWVAKTANLLVDDLGAAPGDRVAVALPAHWLTPVWLLAAWSAGCVVTLAADPGVAVAVVPDDRAATALVGPDVVAVSLRPWGAPGPPPPAGVLDYAREVLGHGDRFAGPRLPPQAPALALPEDELDGAGVVAAARELLAGLGVDETARVQCDLDPGDGPRGALAAGVWPVLLSRGLVLVGHRDPAADAGRAVAERLDAALEP
jgi:uncharacterized protein (TIGR03089 family)